MSVNCAEVVATVTAVKLALMLEADVELEEMLEADAELEEVLAEDDDDATDDAELAEVELDVVDVEALAT